MTRLKTEIWVAAWIRICAAAGASAYLRRRGNAEAGAIILKVDWLDGNSAVYGPALQGDYGAGMLERKFRRLHRALVIPSADAETLLIREQSFDPDVWIVEVEDRQGRVFADVVADQD